MGLGDGPECAWTLRQRGQRHQRIVEAMSGTATFFYGALGATIGAFIVQLLPVGYALAAGKVELVFTVGRFVGMLIILVGLVAVGGLAALGLGSATTASEPLNAIAAGLGWQSTVGGLLNASRT
jgi:hypothetical protein